MSIVIGIDPSLTGTGIAIINDGKVTVHTITSKGTSGDTLAQRRARLAQMRRDIYTVLTGTCPDMVAIEGPSFGQGRQVGTHDRAGLWWLLVDSLHGALVRVAEVPPSTRARYATGKGNASKDAVLLAVARRYPHVDVRNNNEADALLLAAMAARHIGEPIDTPNAACLAAMGSVRWPEVTA